MNHLGDDLKAGEVLAPHRGSVDLHGRVREGLALFGGDDRGKLASRGHQRVGDAEQRLAAVALVRSP